jgi:hypothetical protein
MLYIGTSTLLSRGTALLITFNIDAFMYFYVAPKVTVTSRGLACLVQASPYSERCTFVHVSLNKYLCHSGFWLQETGSTSQRGFVALGVQYTRRQSENNKLQEADVGRWNWGCLCLYTDKTKWRSLTRTPLKSTLLLFLAKLSLVVMQQHAVLSSVFPALPFVLLQLAL